MIQLQQKDLKYTQKPVTKEDPPYTRENADQRMTLFLMHLVTRMN